MQRFVRWSTVAVLIVLFSAAGVAFQFAVAPTHGDEGVREKGSTFHSSFRVFASQDTDVGITVEEGSLDTFRRFKPEDVEQFSAQSCTRCVDFLPGKAGGPVDEQQQSVDTGGQEFKRWRDIEFLYEVPEDLEPGYHLVTIIPSPDASGGSSSISVVSSSSFPVMFRVPGKAVRSGEIIGLRGGIGSTDRKELVATFYNNGTVTMAVTAIFEIEKGNGTEVVGTGDQLVAPGESRELAVFVERKSEEPFRANVTVDYGTGHVTASGDISPAKSASPGSPRLAVDETRLPFTTVALLLMLALTSFVTWKVVRGE